MEKYNSNEWKRIFIEYAIKNNIIFKVGRNTEIVLPTDKNYSYSKYGSYIEIDGTIIKSNDTFQHWEAALDYLLGIK